MRNLRGLFEEANISGKSKELVEIVFYVKNIGLCKNYTYKNRHDA